MTVTAVECLPRFETSRTPERKTFGPAVAGVASAIGFELMPWQRRVFDTALEYDEQTGRFFYREVRLTVPRQCGKTVSLLALMVFRCLSGSNRRVVFTMQDGASAAKKMLYDFRPMLSGSGLRDLFTIRKSNGDQHFMWANDSMLMPLPKTDTAGHGSTLDLAVIDEAFDNDGRSEQAMTPAMVTKRDAQLWIVSTAGTTDDRWFNGKVDDGRRRAAAGETSGVCFFEWSADPAADPGDPETWRSCIPALGHTMDEDTLRAIYESMDTAEFKRAHLNIRIDRSESAPWKVVGRHEWDACGSRERDIAWDSPIVLGLEVPLSRESASIALAGLDEDGQAQLEMVDNRGGTAWVVERIVGLRSRFDTFRGVVIDKGAPAATFIDQLRAEGVEVVEVSGDAHARFAQQFLDAVRDGSVTHRNEDSLTAAVSGATQRNFGDRWLWSRRDKLVDISPLVAATLALGVLTSSVPAEAERPIFAY